MDPSEQPEGLRQDLVDVERSRALTPAARNGPQQERPFYVVGIGASAGGLEALESFFDNMPADSGMAFVVIQHLSPDFKSLMDELLSRHTQLSIHRVEDGMEVEANSIYLIPPKKEMIIAGRRLLLTDKDPKQSLSLPIDAFFRSLAQDLGEHSVGIILSGTGSDGSRGIRAIHEAGGLVVAQSEETAKFDGMPRSAQDTGVVDFVLPPQEMPAVLLKYARHPSVEDGDAADAPPVSHQGMSAIFKILRDEYGIDFSHYKPNTVSRRVQRRLQLNQSFDLEDYIDRLRSDAGELNSLYRDLLIGVTKFFRDQEAFERLEKEVIPQLLARVGPSDELRVWVAACATGEEAYSLAILIHEQLVACGRPIHVKIFATDVHRASLDVASTGIYTEECLSDVAPGRLARYFARLGSAYQVSQDLRKMIVFAPHNIIKDAPFTKLDLISCRNLLIYLQPMAQRKALSLFHFGLRAGGVLFLGPSESPGEITEEFEPIDHAWKVFRKRRDIRLPPDMRLPLSPDFAHVRVAGPGASPIPSGFPDPNLLRAYDALLEEHVPPSFLVNERREIVHTFAGAGRYLAYRDGRATSDLLELVNRDLKLALAGALQRAAKQMTTVTYTGIRIETPEGEEMVRLTVKPISSRTSASLYTLITIQRAAAQAPAPDQPQEIDLRQASQERVQSLEAELRYTKENLQATVEEMETSNEELQATNEELVASNEELQSTNEELHSVNEELYTVNAEYQRKIAELTDLTADMDNLLRSTDIGTIFLDQQFSIRKFTPKMSETFQILPQDVGRRIDSFSHNLVDEDLLEDVRRVLQTERRTEKEVRDRHGKWYLLRILPYHRKAVVEGVVVTLIDISLLKEAEGEAREAIRRRDQFLAMLSHELRNPLGAILNATYVLERDQDDGDSVTSARQAIQRQARQMARLLDDLLDVSRITRGKIEIHREVFDVRSTTEAAVEVVRPLIDSRELHLAVEIADETLPILGDPARLQQIQVNLLTNAARYTKPGGQIVLGLRCEADQVVIQIRDTGVGIRAEMQEKIFELFVQCDSTIHRSSGGMGVGLTLVRELVQLHGGTVRVASDGPGKGSTFTVRLPLSRQPQAKPAGPNELAPPTGPRRVLIVEDNSDCREMLRLLLEHEGYCVETAEDGLKGLEVLRRGMFDVALVDIGLPGLDGYDLAREFRKTCDGQRLCLVALTGYGHKTDRQAALDAGFDEHLVKPLKPEELFRILLRQR